MERVDFGPVILTFDGPVATIELNRPEKQNAMSPEVHNCMHDVLDKIDSNTELRVAVVQGVGETFSAGMDLEKCFLEPFSDPDAYHRATDPASRWFIRWKDLSIPTLAKIRGWCFGGAMLVVGITDMAVAAEDAVFGLSEINFGIPPGGGTMWSVTRNMTRKQALFYSFTAERFDGVMAAEMGFVNKAVPAQELDREVDRIVAVIAEKSRKVLEYTKRFYHHSSRLGFREAQEVELALHHELIYYTRSTWVDKALTQFKQRKFKPGMEPFKG